jgi:nitrilase
MTSLRVAAVQASYVLMDQAATLDRVASLTAEAAAQGAKLVAFPEVFVPGTPVWIDTRPIWDGDEDWSAQVRTHGSRGPGHARCLRTRQPRHARRAEGCYAGALGCLAP